MRFILILCVSLLLAGCVATPPENITTETSNGIAGVYSWHDDDKKVTCWIFSATYQGGIHCIPDWQLEPPQD